MFQVRIAHNDQALLAEMNESSIVDHGVQMDVSESSLGVILLDEELEVSEICGDEPARNKVKL